MNFEKTLKEIAELIDNNDTGGAYLLGAQLLDNKDLIARFESINQKHHRQGYITHKLYAKRHSVYNEMIAFAKDNLCLADFKSFYHSF